MTEGKETEVNWTNNPRLCEDTPQACLKYLKGGDSGPLELFIEKLPPMGQAESKLLLYQVDKYTKLKK